MKKETLLGLTIILILVILPVAGEAQSNAQRKTEIPKLVKQIIRDDESVRSMIGENTFGDDEKTITPKLLEKEITAETLDLNGDGKPEWLLTASDAIGLCGATGACSKWIYGKSGTGYVQLLESSAIHGLSVAKTKTRGYKDLTLAANSGAYETYLYTYKFDGVKYRERSCILRSYLDDRGNVMKRPRMTGCN